MGKRANMHRKLCGLSNDPQKRSHGKQLTADWFPSSALFAQLVMVGFVAVYGGVKDGNQVGNEVETDFCPSSDEQTAESDPVVVKCKKCNTTVLIDRDMDTQTVIRKHDQKNPSCHEPIRLKEVIDIGNGVPAKPTRKVSTTSDIESNVVCDTQVEKSDAVEENQTTEVATATKEITVSKDLAEGAQKSEATATPKHSTCSETLSKIPLDLSKAAHPRFAKFSSRRESLQYWRNVAHCCLEKVAEAGFIFLGAGENELHCFYCDTSVPTLLKNDDAWIEHALRNPECDYIRSVKGKPFLDLIVDTYFDGDPKSRDRDQSTPATSAEKPKPDENAESAQKFQRVPYCGGLKGGGPTIPVPQRSSSAEQGQTIPRYSCLAPNPSQASANTIRRVPRVPKRQVQAREVRARLDMEEAQRIIQMGYHPDLVGAVIADQLIYNGDDFSSFTEMAVAVMKAYEMGEAFPTDHYAAGLKPREPSTMLTHTTNTEMKMEGGNASMAEVRSVPDLNSLLDENEKLKEATTCTVCFDMQRDILFVPCGHLCVCHMCSPKLKSCPLCRKNVSATVKVVYS